MTFYVSPDQARMIAAVNLAEIAMAGLSKQREQIETLLTQYELARAAECCDGGGI